MLPFGETVMWRDPEGPNWTFASSWGFGIWLGREGKSDVHVIGTRLSTFLAKTIRRLPPPERHETQNVAGTARYTVVSANRQV